MVVLVFTDYTSMKLEQGNVTQGVKSKKLNKK